MADSASPKGNKRSGNPARRAGAVGPAEPTTDPYGTGLSGVTAKKTGFMLYWLSQRPKWFLPVVVVLLLLGGLVIHPWGAILMVVLGVILAWLTILSWPALRVGGRITRLLLVIAVFGYAIWEVVAYAIH